ncbi:MAG: chromate transporter [Xanthobacteraceae bacterium]
MAELLVYFLRLGLLGFGGPVALVGQMERELVAERGWLTREQMREAIAICQSLPGPLAIQVGIYTAYLRGGFWGAWLGGWAFILPNFVIVAALGALYVRLGDLKPVTAVFYGVSPAVIALILHSCHRLARLGMEDRLQWLIAAACFAVTVIFKAEVALLFVASGLLGVIAYGNILRRRLPLLALPVAALPSLTTLAPAASGSTLAKLSLFFLKSRLTDIRQRARHRALPATRTCPAIWLVGRTPIPDRGSGRHDQFGTGGHYGDIRWLSCRWLLGLPCFNASHLLSVVYFRIGGSAAARSARIKS